MIDGDDASLRGCALGQAYDGVLQNAADVGADDDNVDCGLSCR